MMCGALTQTSGGMNAAHVLIPFCLHGEDEEEKERNGRKEATVMKEYTNKEMSERENMLRYKEGQIHQGGFLVSFPSVE